MSAFRAILNAACPNLGNYVFYDEIGWRTPSFNNETYPDPKNRRGYEIKEWLRKYDLWTRMFIILDDDSDIAPFEDFYVKCDVYDGVTTQAYLKARAMLGDEVQNA
jgi:hypothetical protein